MNYTSLSFHKQLVILASLAGLTTTQFMTAPMTIPTDYQELDNPILKQLTKYGLSNTVLTVDSQYPLGVQLNEFIGHPMMGNLQLGLNGGSEHRPVARRIDFQIVKTDRSDDAMISSRSQLHGEVLLTDTLISGLIKTADYLIEKDFKSEIHSATVALISAHEKAMTLPTELIQVIENWTSYAELMRELSRMVAHYASADHYDDGELMTVCGRDRFVVSSDNAGGRIGIRYNEAAAYYTGHVIILDYTSLYDLDNRKLTVSIQRDGKNTIELNTILLNDVNSTEYFVNSCITALTEVLNKTDYDDVVMSLISLTPVRDLLDHGVELIAESKPFILAKL